MMMMMKIVKKREDVFIGDIAEEYLRKFATVSGADKTFGLRDKDGFTSVTRNQK